MAKSGFYTNRIRFSEMLARFEEAGFCCEVVHVNRWDTIPTSPAKMAEEFRILPESELLVRSFVVRLRPL